MRTSFIRYRPKSRLVILYEDLLEICDGSMLAAMLLAILIYWTDVKIAKKNETLWIWKSHEDFQEDLLSDKPGMKKPHRTTIKRALDLLKSKKFIYMRKNPKMPLDQTRQYLVNQKAVQDAIDGLPTIVVKATLESIKDDNASAEMQQSMSQNRQSNAEKPTSNTNDYSTEITESEITEEDSAFSDENATPTSSELLEDVIETHDEVKEEIKRISGEHPAVRVENETQYHIADSYGTIGNEDERCIPPLHTTLLGDEPAANEQAVAAGQAPRSLDSADAPARQTAAPLQAPGTGALPSATESPLGRSHGNTSVQAHSVSASPEPAQTPFAASTPPLAVHPPAQASGRKRRTVPERPQLKCDPREVQGRINAHRGYELEEKVEVIRERQAIQTWCSKHTLEEYERVMCYLTTQDKYWKLEENKYRIGGLTLAKETPKALATVERNGKPKDQGWSAEHPPADNDYSIPAEMWRQEQRKQARGTK